MFVGDRPAQFLADGFVGGVDLDPQPLALESGGDLCCVVVVAVGDRDHGRLHRSQPARECPCVVLDEHTNEPLDRTEQGAVDHHRTLLDVVRGGEREVEVVRLSKVELQGGELPAAPDGITNMDIDLGAVERSLAIGDLVRQLGLL